MSGVAVGVGVAVIVSSGKGVEARLIAGETVIGR